MADGWTEGSLSRIDDLKLAFNESFLSFATRAFQQNKALQEKFHQVEEEGANRLSCNAIHSGSSADSSLALSDTAGDPDVEIVNDTELVACPKLPPKAALYRPPLEVGKVYVAKKINSRRNTWSKALLLSVIYNVRQGITNNRCLVKYSDGLVSRRHVEASEIAYLEECPTLIPLGTAVVTNAVSSNTAHYNAGVVLELPNAMNKFRYLVFLDKSSVCYTQHNELRVICDVYQANTSTIDRYFVRDCLSLYPDRFLLRFTIGEKVEVKRKCEWMEGTVHAMDCSIVQLRFSDGSLEWYSRGSYKFKKVIYGHPSTSHPLKYLQKLQRIREKIAPEINEEPEEGPSFAQTQLVSTPSLTTHRVPSLQPQAISHPLTVITPLLVWWPRNLGMHSCDQSCVAGEEMIQRINQKYGPLVWPLCAGFKRLKEGRTISYKAPCGQILYNYTQLRHFLDSTKLSLNYDHFDFSTSINAQRVYEPNPNSILASLNDISNGLEKYSISCVNEVNNQLPEPITYITKRKFLTYSDELMNNDGNFVSCCSCEDDCKDPAKCDCIQLTINSYLEIKELDNPLAPSEMIYQYKRLFNEVQSGIYECNQGCKCSSGCPNRLVQFPLSAKLQLFQTGKKGWGVRALHDLPKGSFVSTYVGVLLNEREANEWGILHGDEYLSDLDFIQKQESFKPDYEEDVAELSDLEPNSNTGRSNTTSSELDQRLQLAGNNHDPPKRRSSRAHSQPPFEIKKRRYTNKKTVMQELPKCSVKRFFPVDFSEFTIDAKNAGNIGRYFNHACEPNMFVQNVFVDTHDLRLPWVAFFTRSDVTAGTELTWDYGYSVGSVESSQTCSFGELKAIKQVVTTDQLNPEATGALILMHGTGDNAKCFSRMINYLMGQKAAFPHIRIIYPTAPFTPYTPALGVPTTTWFDISNYTMDAVENKDHIQRVGHDLLRIIDSQVKCGIPLNRIAVGGFSRGGAMAFHVGFNLAPDIAAVGVMSSWIPYSSVIYKLIREKSPSQKLPVLLQQHGDYDEMVNISEGRTTFEELRKLGVQGKFVALPRQGHVVSKREIQDLFQFVSELIPEQV